MYKTLNILIILLICLLFTSFIVPTVVNAQNDATTSKNAEISQNVLQYIGNWVGEEIKTIKEEFQKEKIEMKNDIQERIFKFVSSAWERVMEWVGLKKEE